MSRESTAGSSSGLGGLLGTMPAPASIAAGVSGAAGTAGATGAAGATSTSAFGGGAGLSSSALVSSVSPIEALTTAYQELLSQYQDVLYSRDQLQVQLDRSSEQFTQHDRQFRNDLGQLEDALKGPSPDEARFESLRQLRHAHSTIQETIAQIQGKTARVIKDHEHALVRAFKQRLAVITKELEDQKIKNSNGSAEWVQRCNKLSDEARWLREYVDKLTQDNKVLIKENRRMKKKMKAQEEDREFLIKQLVSVKKENARLRYNLEQVVAGGGDGGGASAAIAADGSVTVAGLPASAAMAAAVATSSSSLSPPPLLMSASASSAALAGSASAPALRPVSGALKSGANGAGTSASLSSSHSSPVSLAAEVERFQSTVQTLQRQLDDQKRRYKELSTTYTAEVASRHDMHDFLLKCIDEVKALPSTTALTQELGVPYGGMGAPMVQTSMRPTSAAKRGLQTANGRPLTMTASRAALLPAATSGGAIPSVSSTSAAATAAAAAAAAAAPHAFSSRAIVDLRQQPLVTFSPQERLLLLQHLLSNEAFVHKLFESMFPRSGTANGSVIPGRSGGSPRGGGGGGGGQVGTVLPPHLGPVRAGSALVEEKSFG